MDSSSSQTCPCGSGRKYKKCCQAKDLRSKWLHRAAAAAIALLTVLVFMPVLRNGFVNFDDDGNILRNPFFRGLSWSHVRWAFTSVYGGPYQPFTWLTFSLDHQIWGLDPRGYHLTSLLLHAANAALFYLLNLRLLSLARPDLRGNSGSLNLGLAAGAAALLFSLHPLRVEVAAWASARAYVLSAFFFLLTVLLWLRSVEAGDSAGCLARRTLSWGAYVCALLSKAIVLPLPAVLILLDVYPLRRLPGDPRQWVEAPYRGIWREKLPFLLMVPLFAVAEYHARLAGQSISQAFHPQEGLLPRLIQPAFGLAFYLWKSAWPFQLLPLYERPAVLDPWAWPFALSIAGVSLTSIGLFSLRRRFPAALAAWVYYVVMAAPVLGFVSYGPQLAADRYTYFSCLGWATLAGAGIFHALCSGVPLLASTAALATLILPAALGFQARNQLLIWRDGEALWTHTLKVAPRHFLANLNLGSIRYRQGRYDAAENHWRETLRVDPAYADAHYGLGNIKLGAGKPDEAIRHYLDALKSRPDYFEAHYSMGSALQKLGKTDEALSTLRRALALRPYHPEASHSIGTLLHAQGKPKEAIEFYRRAVASDPHHAESHFAIGTILLSSGDNDGAIGSFSEAVEADPTNVNARNNLAVALTNLGRFDEAIEQCRLVLQIQPAHVNARRNLEALLKRVGR